MNKKVKNIFPYFVLLIVVLGTLYFYNMTFYEVHNLTTGELYKEIKDKNVTEITITPKSDDSIYYVEGKLKDYKETESFSAKVIPEDVNTITTYVKENNIKEYLTENMINIEQNLEENFIYSFGNYYPIILKLYNIITNT